MFVVRQFWRASAAMLLALVPTSANAQSISIDSGATAWLLATALLALIGSVPGLILFHAGRSAPRHGLATAGQGLLVAAIGSIVWLAAGYSLAFAPGAAWLGGGANLLMANLGFLGDQAAIPEAAFVMSSMASAIIAAVLATIVIADRVRLGWLLPFVTLWVLVVLAPVTHWLAFGGLLANMGTVDYGGGLSIHLVAGASALVLGLLCGPRLAADEREPAQFSPLLALTGIGLAWVGLLATIGGASVDGAVDGPSAMLIAHLCCVSALLTWAGLDRLGLGKSSATGLAKGAMAGLAVSASLAGTVGFVGAILAGVIGAALCRISETALPVRLRFADPLSIVAIHGIGGLAGTLLMAPLASSLFGGPGFAEGAGIINQLFAQITGAAMVIGWAAAGTAVLGFALTALVPIRVSAEEEIEGLSLARHGENG